MFLEGFITSKTRIKLLLKFFINPGTISYLRQLADEFGESTNSVRLELNSLTDAKILEREKSGNTVAYKVNTKYPLYSELRSIILKSIGIDKVIETIIENLGKPEAILLTGDYAHGIDAGIIDIIIIGNIDKSRLDEYTKAVEKKIDRKVRYLILERDEFEKLKTKLEKDGVLLLWGK